MKRYVHRTIIISFACIVICALIVGGITAIARPTASKAATGPITASEQAVDKAAPAHPKIATHPLKIPSNAPVSPPAKSLHRTSKGALAAALPTGCTSVSLNENVLVIAADGTETDLPDITQELQYLYTPYTVYTATKTPGGLTAAVLSNGCTGNYDGVILTTGDLGYNSSGGYVSALSQTEWNTLWAYESSFGVREVSWYTYPTADYGFQASTGAVDTTLTPIAGTLSTLGATNFSYLNTANPVTIQNAYTYLAKPLTDGTTTALLSDASGNALMAQHLTADGRLELAQTFDNNQYLIHSITLAYGLVNWVTGGLFLGERHVYMSAQVDDLLIDDTVWPPTTPCGTNPDSITQTYRINAADLQALINWQNAKQAIPISAQTKLTMAFNGAGSEVGAYTPDDLTPAVETNQALFNWVNHTYDHTNLDSVTAAQADAEIKQNNTIAASPLKLTNFNIGDMVTPDISGLTNAAFLSTAYADGIRYLVSNTSIAGENNPAPNIGIYNTLEPGILEIPRKANNLFFNVQDPNQWVAEYNCLYNSYWKTNLTYAQILGVESQTLLSYLLQGDIDPWMFHQPNLAAYDNTHSLLGDLIDMTLQKYSTYYNLPIVNQQMDSIGQTVASRMQYLAAGVTASIVPGVSITLKATKAATVPVTGLKSTGSEVYGGQDISYVTLAAGVPVTLPLASTCATGWSCSDIGSPTPAGTQTLSGGTWSVQGGGSDIWGTSDQFHFVSQPLSADGSVSAHIASQTNSDPWAKAGVMLRQTSDPGSPYYAAFVTPGNGIAVQYRTAQGASSQFPLGLSGTVPTYLKVARSGTTYTTYTSSDGVNWTLVAGSGVTIAMSGSVLAGLAVTSHNSGSLSSVSFDTVSISTPSCGTGWSCADIGSPALAGSQSVSSSGTWSVQGGGADIWGTSDQFRFISQSLAADGSVSAHIASQTISDPWAKAGVMLRQTSDPGSPYYAAFVTPGNGIVVQYRTAQGASAQSLVGVAGTVPTYLKVARSGTTFTAYTSSDGVNWTLVPGSGVTISMSGAVLAGLAVTAHNSGSLSTVSFDTVSISTPSCGTGWSCADIGSPGLSGTQSLGGSTWTVQGGGSDIWGTADQFRFISQSLAADGSVSARVVSQSNSDPWAKAGVMLRQTSDPGSPYYAAFVTPGNGIAVQYRTAQGASAQSLVGVAGTVPTYLEVARTGTTFTAYTSSDGVKWTLVPGSGVTISMSGAVLAGLAVTAHNSGSLSSVSFDTVSISTPNCGTGWSCGDIGSPGLPGSQSLSGSTWSVQGGGADIWGTADQFHIVYQSLAADGSVSARVVSQSNSDPWAKAGVMLRQNTNPNSAYYAAYVTPGNGIAVQYRTTIGGASAQYLLGLSGTVPTYLAVNRTGTTYTTYTSSDGVTWTVVPGSSVTIAMSGSVLAGLVVTAHNNSSLSSVTFDTVVVSNTVP